VPTKTSERKDPSRGICPGEVVKEKNPSRVSVIVIWMGYFMAYGVIESISMSSFVEGALSLELPLSKTTFFQTP
jgi:hypothetical protein